MCMMNGKPVSEYEYCDCYDECIFSTNIIEEIGVVVLWNCWIMISATWFTACKTNRKRKIAFTWYIQQCSIQAAVTAYSSETYYRTVFWAIVTVIVWPRGLETVELWADDWIDLYSYQFLLWESEVVKWVNYYKKNYGGIIRYEK